MHRRLRQGGRMPELVCAVPWDLLAVADRTRHTDAVAHRAGADLDGALAAVGRAGLGRAVLAHVERSGVLAGAAATTGLALLLAGGAAGAMALALHGRTVAPEAAAPVL